MLVFITSADIEHPLKEMRTEEYRHTALWMKENLGDHSLAWIECVRAVSYTHLRAHET